jgi:imidazole glycerol-phosphate synthase subunit HisH
LIAIVDSGTGNLSSIRSKLGMIGFEAQIISSPDALKPARKIILPGVGYFKTAMQNLRSSGLADALAEKVLHDKVPILGICLGMQLFTEHSEEGDVPGLGWIPGSTRRFDFPAEAGLRVPHVGWNDIETRSTCVLWRDIPTGKRFYFTHSYFVTCRCEDDVAATCEYGVRFVAAVEHNNILGTQFHPEKSHTYGLKIIENFLRHVPC